MPLWARHLIAMVIALLVAYVLAPVFPGPVDVVIFWLAIVVAVIFAVYMVVDIFQQGM